MTAEQWAAARDRITERNQAVAAERERAVTAAADLVAELIGDPE